MVDVRCSTRTDGDFHLDHVPEVVLAHRRACLMAGTWSQPDEVHGATVLTVEAPGDHHRAIADGLVTGVPGAVLGIWVGDCAPVVLMSDRGALAAVHAGWRGLAGGIIATAAERLAGRPVLAVLGPCIHPCCYEFGDELDDLSARWGAGVRATTSWGTPALDVPAAVRAEVSALGVAEVVQLGACTGCRADLFFSHRRRAELGRQVMSACLRTP